MTISERLAGLDLRALIFSLLVAAGAIAALSLLVDRLERIAEAKSLAGDRDWIAASGTNLRLAGLPEGSLLGIETSPGGGLTASADEARLLDGRPAHPLIWASEGDPKADNKTEVQVSLTREGGAVRISRSGETEVPQLRIRPEGTDLRVDAGVTIGDLMVAPVTRIVLGQQDVPQTGPAFSFLVPAGRTLAIEFPALPNGQPSGVVTRIGAVRPEEEDSVLPMREAGIYEEGATHPEKTGCAANQRFAWKLFLRADWFPVPSGADCAQGIITARNFYITGQAVGVSLAGKSAWVTQDGMPTTSLWSWTKQNPVLELVINKLLPAIVGAILGLVAWRRKAATAPAAREKKRTKKISTRSAARK